ncbi:acyl-CoA thioesterase [Kordiimonas lacus]|uniref:4-hydroxybenzoyl-CoA thioesterase n=1 Tax=Kordiimonas lacus TaxID=637679 RepID=A0A1G7EG34_9PROT|nr:thioesterase family protein [Kordiimonas lacus]SDE62601.1 4-hydroxybenzoyl-CoA thioesterase [Kordiimonas lacus]
MATFVRTRKIRFAHTDAAGIAFYPRYFGMMNDFIEDWFGDGLGFDFKHLHIDEKRAVPTVHIEADFIGAGHMHDELSFALAVTKIGRSSVHLRIHATCAGEDRFRMTFVIAHMDMETGKSLPWPDDMRAAMEKWLAPTGDPS